MALEKLISNNNDSINFNVTLQEVLDLMIKNKTKHFVLTKKLIIWLNKLRFRQLYGQHTF